jgi:hypothetical protein
MHPSTIRTATSLLLLAFALAAAPAMATEVWSGRTLAFSKPPGADWNQAPNQDRITNRVWITRANTAGIFNIAQESLSGGGLGLSPLDTEWASGDAVTWPSLTFQPWVGWAQQYPPGTVGVNACVHLITDDIYIDIVFDSWGEGAYGGGSFAYRRAPRPAPTAAHGDTWGRLKALYR